MRNIGRLRVMCTIPKGKEWNEKIWEDLVKPTTAKLQTQPPVAPLHRSTRTTQTRGMGRDGSSERNRFRRGAWRAKDSPSLRPFWMTLDRSLCPLTEDGFWWRPSLASEDLCPRSWFPLAIGSVLWDALPLPWTYWRGAWGMCHHWLRGSFLHLIPGWRKLESQKDFFKSCTVTVPFNPCWGCSVALSNTFFVYVFYASNCRRLHLAKATLKFSVGPASLWTPQRQGRDFV